MKKVLKGIVFGIGCVLSGFIFVVAQILLYGVIPLRGSVGGFYLGADTLFMNKQDKAGVSVQLNGESLRVLLITDTHYMGLPLFVDARTDRGLRKLVDKTEPELILLLGDNVATLPNHWAQARLIRTMDSFGVPWAPLFGNHDGRGKADTNYLAGMFKRSRYSIFRWGPNNIGVPGNYFINIKKDSKPVHTFFMLSNRPSPWLSTNYPPLTYGQVRWYQWAVNGIAQQHGQIIPSTLVLHAPLLAFQRGYKYGQILGGAKREPVMYVGDNGLFDRVLELGSTKNIIAGHDHTNDFSVLYRGIRLSYVIASNRNVAAFGAYGRYAGGMLVTVSATGDITQRIIKI